METELLRVNNLCQQFGTFSALVDVNFTIKPGEILGVVGQRGAGKSILFQLLIGKYQPQQGEIIFEGRHLNLHNVSQAHDLGIVAVPEIPKLVNELDVLSNIFLGAELRWPSFLPVFPNQREMYHIACEFLETAGVGTDLIRRSAHDFSDEQRQVVALARAFCRPSRLLLLDNAIEALSFERQQKLLSHLLALAGEGQSIIISSDDINHIFEVTDKILVLYQGRQVALLPTAETTPRDIVERVVGSNNQDRVTPMIWAYENYHLAQQQVEDLRRTQVELRQSLEVQGSLNRQLVDRLQNQVEALDSLNLALQEASRRLITERESERKALARELHDQVIQDLLSYNYQLEEAENEIVDPLQRRALSDIRTGIRTVVGSLRQICSDLRPPTIDNHGLSAAIRSLASQWGNKNGILVDLEIDSGLGRLPETIELSVFRIIQEGLSNVRKHADATCVQLSLKRTPTASLVVRLADDGKGLPEPLDLASLTAQKHFGLVGISERVSLLSGTLQIEATHEGGVVLCIEIPSPYPSIHP